MDLRVTLFLMLVAIVLGAIVLISPAAENPDTTPSPVVSVLSFDADDVASVELENRERDRVLAEKQNSNWIVVSPRKRPGDDRRLDSFVSRIASLVASARFHPEEPLSNFGLDPPTLTVSITMSRGDQLHLHVGAKTADRRWIYGATEDRTEIFLIPNLIADDAMRLITEPPYVTSDVTANP